MSRYHVVYDTFESPVGTLYLVFSGSALIGVSFTKPGSFSFKAGAMPDSLNNKLADYFSGKEVDFDQEMVLRTGTEFERHVWSVVQNIPFAETRPYKWVAEQTGSPGATRAVGRALSKNPILIIIPCHRVIESDGSVGGYSSGKDIKRRLLDIEYYGKINS